MRTWLRQRLCKHPDTETVRRLDGALVSWQCFRCGKTKRFNPDALWAKTYPHDPDWEELGYWDGR